MLEGRWLIPGDQNAIAVNERFREVFPISNRAIRCAPRFLGKETDLVVVGFLPAWPAKAAGYLAYTTYEFLSSQIHQINRATRITG